MAEIANGLGVCVYVCILPYVSLYCAVMSRYGSCDAWLFLLLKNGMPDLLLFEEKHPVVHCVKH